MQTVTLGRTTHIDCMVSNLHGHQVFAILTFRVFLSLAFRDGLKIMNNNNNEKNNIGLGKIFSKPILPKEIFCFLKPNSWFSHFVDFVKYWREELLTRHICKYE